MACIFKPWEYKGEKLFRCERCAYKTKYEHVVREDCRPIYQPQYEGPGLLQKIENFTLAAGEHLKNGSPMVSEEVVKERLDICKNCPAKLYRNMENGIGGVCIHESCGCSVKDSVEYFNKLAWADQKCPLGYWIESSGFLK